ncbi:DUF4350 domain-containing protein [Flavobacterium sp.]|uniref:DUF4350 domain-containing protein n=1 Tax=Flavobacterium sp. TaxID=239 RepID=UPI002604C560|nr:DUF4350 domain-containing protein [Flavobacterium sp.]
MNRTLKIYIGLIVLMVVLVAFLDSTKPKPVDWSPTYRIEDKIPFGLYIFDKELPELFDGKKVTKVNSTPYEYFGNDYQEDTLGSYYYHPEQTFLSISEKPISDKQSEMMLLRFVAGGNHAFISSKGISRYLMDTLKLDQEMDFQYAKDVVNWVGNPKLGTKKYKITEGLGNVYFSKIDTLTTTVLGYQSGDTARANFIKVPFHKGYFLLHTQPAAFTNFHLLKDDHAAYAEKVLSYLPKKDIVWFMKGNTRPNVSNSIFRFILTNQQLSWAWYIFLGGLLVFLIFNAKRRQRIVPIIPPVTNTTIDFAKTIGNLYFQEGDHDNLIDKKIIYFLEKLRQDYLMDTAVLDDKFITRLQLKSGKKLEDIQNVVYLINNHRKKYYTATESDLIAISQAIEKIVS